MEFQSTQEQASHNWAEFEDLAKRLKTATPTELPRTWGYEIETPEADKVANNADSKAESLIDFHQDGSVSGADGCECDCSDCEYHECDCQHCENTNTDPEHGCGSAWCVGRYQEIVSRGGLKTTHPEALEILPELGLEDCEITDECGLHIHIASKDLTPLQVARVITTYRIASDILDPIAGEARKHNTYCRPNDPRDEELARHGEGTDKYRAVNTRHHFSPFGGRPQTIEFRQSEGTNDIHRVRAWAWLLVQLVEFAKSDRPVYWVGKATTLNELIKALG